MKSIYDQMFSMKYYSGWSLIELYSLPIGLRNWFAERLIKQLKEEREQ